MNRRSLFKKLIGAALVPAVAKAIPVEPVKKEKFKDFGIMIPQGSIKTLHVPVKSDNYEPRLGDVVVESRHGVVCKVVAIDGFSRQATVVPIKKEDQTSFFRGILPFADLSPCFSIHTKTYKAFQP